MNEFANPRVEDAVRQCIEAVLVKAHGDDVRSARVRFTGDRGGFNFAWVMVDRMSVKLNGSEDSVDGLWVHTNDADFMIGSPPSLTETCALNDIDAVIEIATQFVASQVGKSARVELLLQADFNGGKHEGNYVGNSDEGFEALHVQPELLTD